MSEFKHMSTGRPEAGEYYAGLYNEAQFELDALQEENKKLQKRYEDMRDRAVEFESAAECAELGVFLGLQREAALREELANNHEELSALLGRESLTEQHLAATEQRNSDTIAKLEIAASMMDDDERGNRFAEVCILAIKSLKPTESGASE